MSYLPQHTLLVGQSAFDPHCIGTPEQEAAEAVHVPLDLVAIGSWRSGERRPRVPAAHLGVPGGLPQCPPCAATMGPASIVGVPLLPPLLLLLPPLLLLLPPLLLVLPPLLLVLPPLLLVLPPLL